MRVLGSFMFFSLAGIISSVLAQEQISDQLFKAVEKISEIEKISNGLIDKLTEVAETICEEDWIRKKCERNGGLTENDVSNYANAGRKYVRCFHSFMNVTQFAAEVAAARSNNREHKVIENYCLKVPTYKNCTENFIASIEPCLGSEERESVNHLYDFTKYLVRFACENNGTYITKNFIAAGGIECLGSKYRGMQECSSQIYPCPAEPNAVVIPFLGVLPKLTLDVTGCSNDQKYQDCSVKVLEQCESSVPAVIANDYFNFVKTERSCDIIPFLPAVYAEETIRPE